jgi:hypothetical protein
MKSIKTHKERQKSKYKIKLKRKPKAPHNTTTYLIKNKSYQYSPNTFETGGTNKYIIHSSLDYDSTDDSE